MAEYKIGDKLICKAKGDFEGKLVVLEYKNTYGKWAYSTLPWSLDSRCGIWDHKECPNDFELYVETPVNHEVKPPLGLRPWNIADNERVVEILASGFLESQILVDDLLLVQGGLHVQDGLPFGLQQRVQTANHRHRENDISIFATDIHVPKDVVGNAPDEVGDPGKLCLIQVAIFP